MYRMHREGRSHVVVSSLLLAALVIGFYWVLRDSRWIWLAYLLGLAALVLFALILNFFRNPARTVMPGERAVIAPCDGKVVVMERVIEDEYFKSERLQVSIFMSPLNVHVNRNPISGIVRYLKYKPGKFLVAWHPKSSTDNEQTYLVVENDRFAVGFKQIAGAVARRIRWYVQEGQAVQQGQEFGFIKYGSRMDLLLPVDADVKVSLGQIVRGGETVVAEVG